jgi:hypothetical protein
MDLNAQAFDWYAGFICQLLTVSNLRLFRALIVSQHQLALRRRQIAKARFAAFDAAIKRCFI